MGRRRCRSPAARASGPGQSCDVEDDRDAKVFAEVRLKL
jgi:hypothetical protein